jgi:hypothetical protein
MGTDEHAEKQTKENSRRDSVYLSHKQVYFIMEVQK